jgi:hypothetical protein
VKVFFLSLRGGGRCMYGAATVGRKILFIQAVPAAVGLALAGPGLTPQRLVLTTASPAARLTRQPSARR